MCTHICACLYMPTRAYVHPCICAHSLLRTPQRLALAPYFAQLLPDLPAGAACSTPSQPTAHPGTTRLFPVPKLGSVTQALLQKEEEGREQTGRQTCVCAGRRDAQV